MSSVFAAGQWRATSCAETSSFVTPNPRTNAASRRSVSRRCGVVARCRCPIGRKPVERPVSASSVVHRSRV